MKGVVTSGDRIGRYRLLETLGEGGMGVVHLGVDPEGRKVAIKVLRPAVAGDTTALRRLAREVDTMRRVHSPHVAEIIDADVTAERPYIITQFVPGRTLEQTVETDGPLAGAALQRLATGLAAALSAIHAAGVVHRDLKPGNIMFLDGEPVVIDFGIAQGMDATRLTATGMVIGTPGYLAPEIIEGEDAGPPSDVHSWAGSLVFGATGRPPFGSGTFESIFYKIMQGTPDLNGVPEALLPLIRAAMARNPAERPTAVKLTQLARRIQLDATITDQTRIDRPIQMASPPVPPRDGTRSGQRHRPEPVPAQPKDFKGLLPPAAPPPPPAPAPAPGPYDSPPWRRGYGAGHGRQPYNPYADGQQAHPAAGGLSRQAPPPAPPPYEPQPFDRGQVDATTVDGRAPEQRRRDGRQSRPDQPARPKPFGWYRLLSLATLVGLLGYASMQPVMALLVVICGTFVLRVGDRAAQSMESKRVRKGPSGGDVVGAVLKSPFAVPRALLTTTMVAPLGLLAGLIILLALMVARADITAARAISYSSMVVIVLLCLGPGSGAPRRQLARLWGVILPRRDVAIAATLVLGLFTTLLLGSGLAPGREPTTGPLPGLAGSLTDLRNKAKDVLRFAG